LVLSAKYEFARVFNGKRHGKAEITERLLKKKSRDDEMGREREREREVDAGE